MPLTETAICNMALGRIGAKRLAALDTDDSPEAILCRLHYSQTRDALFRFFTWTFASTRLSLVDAWATATAYTTDQYVWQSSVLYKCAIAHTSGTFATDLAAAKWTVYSTRPSFEWDYQYVLPSDYLRMIYNYSENESDLPNERFTIESKKLLTNDDEALIVYIRQVTDPAEFDPLFVEILVLQLALKLINPIAGTGTISLKEEIKNDLKVLIPQAKAICRQETNTSGRNDWILARYGSGTAI